MRRYVDPVRQIADLLENFEWAGSLIGESEIGDFRQSIPMMKLEENLVSFAKGNRPMMRVVHDFCLNVSPGNCLLGVLGVGKPFG